jgi:sarcosine oxidase subunit gamma
LRETSPVAGLPLPLELGAARLTALPMGTLHAIAPWPGAERAVADRLGGFPEPGQVIDTASGRLAWSGRAAALLFGAAPDLAGLAAVTDQSDGWAGVRLDGADAVAVLARLVPLDLAALVPPAAARSQLNHLPLLLVHPAPEMFELWSYRSMAGTLVHELEAAMRGVAARRARG